jgi:ubiquinol-cytochrome c reductase cytochrome c1 subunit
MRKLISLISILLILSTNAFASGSSETSALHPKQLKWEFDGFFGRFDRASIQRGFQVYKEVCASCHNAKLFSYRNLGEAGFTEDEVKTIASEYTIVDGPNDDGDMFERPALPSDKFVGPFENDNQARSANGGALPPDLSLMVKARGDGANYIYSLLRGYNDNIPDHFELTEGKYYNPYFEGRQISMMPPLGDDELVEYQDGTYATKEQMTIDVVNFLQFVAEGETEKRKKMGVRSILFLIFMTSLFMIAKKRVWSRLNSEK